MGPDLYYTRMENYAYKQMLCVLFYNPSPSDRAMPGWALLESWNPNREFSSPEHPFPYQLIPAISGYPSFKKSYPLPVAHSFCSIGATVF